ncbi:MAG TPA: dolichyl-phosphate beta-glucosyltransferase [Pyrinomonadaceae bacterium]|nr:dolichyl-phosphate beta-glucosyltransferase [Pyrinomonadaceae bacterium]
MQSSLSIVIPAYNEAARLGLTLPSVFSYLKENCADAEVIVVDDGSTDETCAVAERAFAGAGQVGATLIRNRPNRGKGHAVRAGLLAARTPVALFCDADLSTPMSETPKLMSAIEEDGCDIAFGSRALDRGLIGVHQPWRREQGGRVFNAIVRLATGLPFSDTQCGFKAFRMSACRPVIEAATIDRFGFDVELLYVAHLAKLKLREVAVRWDHNEGSKVDVARDSLRMLDEVRLIRRQARRGLYERAVVGLPGATAATNMATP